MSEAVCPFHHERTPARFAVLYRHQGVDYVDHACGRDVDQVVASLRAGDGVVVQEVREIAQLDLLELLEAEGV